MALFLSCEVFTQIGTPGLPGGHTGGVLGIDDHGEHEFGRRGVSDEAGVSDAALRVGSRTTRNWSAAASTVHSGSTSAAPG